MKFTVTLFTNNINNNLDNVNLKKEYHYYSYNIIIPYVLVSDIDECTEGTDACDDLCHNTNGSYYCSCSGSGYRLQTDNVSCESNLINFETRHTS